MAYADFENNSREGRLMTSDSRLHVTSIICRAIDDMHRSVIVVTGVLFVYRGGVRNLRYLFPFLLLYFLAAALWETLYWYRFVYRLIDDDFIVIRSGVLRRRRRTVPFDRIEHVRLSESITSRLFGLTGLHCETAGTRDESEVEFRYVSADTASRLRQTLESNRLDEQRDTRATETELYALSSRQLLAYSLLRIHYVPVILAVGSVVSIAVLSFEASASLTALVVTSVRSVLPIGFGLSKWGTLVLLAIGAGWALGAVRSAVRMYNFRLSCDGDTLYRRRGLVSRVEEEIPIENVQIVRCSDNPILRLLGQTELDVQTAGGSEIMPFDSRTTLVPLARRADIEAITGRIAPLDCDDRENVPKRARTRYFVRYLLFVLLAVVVTVFARDYVTAFASVPLRAYILPAVATPIAAHVRWVNVSYACGTDHLRIRGGFWRRREYALPYSNVQQYTISQSVFQRRAGLSTLRVETAAYPLSIGAVIPDMDTGAATKLGDQLTQQS